MPPLASSKYYDYSGVIHIHSTHSDGYKTVEEIVEAAQKADCQYLILTDHDTLKGLSREGLYGNTLLLVGEEITVVNDQGHYLALRLKNTVNPGLQPQDTINEVQKQGGLGFIAHPFSRNKNFKYNLTPVTWKDWNITEITGIEIWNYSHDWVENFTWYNFLIGWLFPDTFIEGPLPEAIDKWDQFNQKRRTIAIASVDAHGLFYPYPQMFRTLHTHLLLENPLSLEPECFTADKNLIYQALEKGHCYLGYDHLGDSGGFFFSASNAANNEEKGIMGDIVYLEQDLKIQVKVPQPAQIRLFRNGQLIISAEETRNLDSDISEPGVYRVEVYQATGGLNLFNQNLCPWIFSNAIYVYP